MSRVEGVDQRGADAVEEARASVRGLIGALILLSAMAAGAYGKDHYPDKCSGDYFDCISYLLSNH